MRNSISAALIALVITTAAAPAGAQSFLDKVTGKLAKWSGAATSTPQGAPSSLLAPITPAQSAAIDRLLAEPLDDPEVAADRAQAAPVIRMVLETGACARMDGAWNATNRYQLEPGTFDEGLPWLVPNKNTKYHDQSKCLDVVRLTEWSKPAKNALRFRGFYVADDSGEAGDQKFELQKGSDGQWLIRSIGWGDF